MGRRTRELILAAAVCGGLAWGLHKPAYKTLVLDPAMRRAVDRFDLAGIRRLVEQGADVNTNLGLNSSRPLASYVPDTPLRVAIGFGDRDAVQFLIRRGADVHQVNAKGVTPLMLATRNLQNPGMVRVAEALIIAGGRINDTDQHGNTALIYAVDAYSPHLKNETTAMVRLLLRHGADPNVAPDDFTALARAEDIQATKLARILRTVGGANRDTCLERIAAKGPLYAVRSGRLAAVKRLVRRKASFRESDAEGTTLTAAATDFTATILPYLLKHARDIDRAFLNERGGGSETPLTAAARINHWASVKHLLKAGADPSVPDAWGNTPLHLAAMSGRTTMARQLLKAGANVNARDNAGRTALHWVQGPGDKPMEALLLSAGAVR